MSNKRRKPLRQRNRKVVSSCIRARKVQHGVVSKAQPKNEEPAWIMDSAEPSPSTPVLAIFGAIAVLIGLVSLVVALEVRSPEPLFVGIATWTISAVIAAVVITKRRSQEPLTSS